MGCFLLSYQALDPRAKIHDILIDKGTVFYVVYHKIWFVLKDETVPASASMGEDSTVDDLKMSIKAEFPDKLSNLTQHQIDIYLKKSDSQARTAPCLVDDLHCFSVFFVKDDSYSRVFRKICFATFCVC